MKKNQMTLIITVKMYAWKLNFIFYQTEDC